MQKIISLPSNDFQKTAKIANDVLVVAPTAVPTTMPATISTMSQSTPFNINSEEGASHANDALTMAPPAIPTLMPATISKETQLEPPTVRQGMILQSMKT